MMSAALRTLKPCASSQTDQRSRRHPQQNCLNEKAAASTTASKAASASSASPATKQYEFDYVISTLSAAGVLQRQLGTLFP